MAPTLFALEGSPPCRAVFLVAKAIGLDLDIKIISMSDGDHRKPEFLKMNPAHTVPAMKDGDVAFGESRAILCYLMNKYAPDSDLYPKDPGARGIIDSRLYYDSSLFSVLRNGIVVPLVFNKDLKAHKEQLSSIKETLQILESFLENSSYVAGNKLSIADLSILAVISTLDEGGFDSCFGPKTKAWLKKLKELPYYSVNDVGAKRLGAAVRKAVEDLEG